MLNRRFAIVAALAFGMLVPILAQAQNFPVPFPQRPLPQKPAPPVVVPMVWVAEWGTKFHADGIPPNVCRYLWHTPFNLRVPRWYAVQMGRTPCSVCRP